MRNEPENPFVDDLYGVERRLELVRSRIKESKEITPRNKELISRYTDNCNLRGLSKLRVLFYLNRFWRAFEMRVRQTELKHSDETRLCTVSIDSMCNMRRILGAALTAKAKILPPYQQFVFTYFGTIEAYLQSVYLLSCGWFYQANQDLQRTVHETILKGYLFIVENGEADLMYSYVKGTINPTAKRKLEKRRLWPFDFMCEIMYDNKTKKAHQKLYRTLSRFSHPTITGAALDSNYTPKSLLDSLNMTLSYSYGSIQMVCEAFFDSLDSRCREIAKTTMTNIANHLSFIPVFEPNNSKYRQRLKLKEGNFSTVL